LDFLKIYEIDEKHYKNKILLFQQLRQHNTTMKKRVGTKLGCYNLLWRICRGCLPTRVRLRGRYVPCPSECPFCNNNEEDDWHILFGFRESQQVWIEAGLRDVIMLILHAAIDVNNVIFDVCRFEDVLTVGKFAMVVWCIWHNRNNWVWNGVKDSAKEVAMRAAHMLAEWCAVHTMQQNSSFESVAAVNHAAVSTEHGSPRESHVIQLLRWQKPRDGWWKLLAQRKHFDTLNRKVMHTHTRST
jgi:hypothetical protein